MIKNSVDIITLGCSKNLVDSERLMHRFAEAGYKVRHDPEKVSSEFVVVNTCGFIGDAKEESIEMILQMVEAKKAHKIHHLYVMGCLSQRYREELETEIPEVDKFYGKFDWTDLLTDLGSRISEEKDFGRILTTPPHYAYVKIAEGCNRFCSYCAIPLITGRFVSYPMEQLLDEVKSLVSQGVKEFQIIAQDLSSYGLAEYDTDLIVLAGFINKISDPLLNAYPGKIINIHPALLPKYGGKGMYGIHVHKAVVAAGERETGITIHYIDEHYDEGTVIFQAKCPVLPSDTPEEVAAKVHALEYAHYPKVIEDLLAARI